MTYDPKAKALTPEKIFPLIPEVMEPGFRALNWKGDSYHVALLFEQPSTRTLMSFVLACHNIGVTPTIMPAGATAQEKGESLTETFQNLYDMGYDAMIYRGFGAYGPTDMPVINAGNKGEHPTQALIDLYTAEQIFTRKIHVLLEGDTNSRVAQSVADLFRSRGHTVEVCYGDVQSNDTSPDIIMVFRWQDGRPCADPITKIPLGAYLMAPGPLTDEIDHKLINHDRCLIRQQVLNATAVRAAVVYSALN